MIRFIGFLLLCISLHTVTAQQQAALTQSASTRQHCSSTKFFVKLTSTKHIPMASKTFGIDEVDAILSTITVTGIAPLVPSKGLLKASEQSASGVERIFLVYCAPESDLQNFVKKFAGIASVEYASPYWIYEFTHAPNDALYTNQWALTQMKLDQAWDITTGDSSIVIGIIDSGIDMDHPDLEPNLYTNPGEWGPHGMLANNGIDDDNNGYVDDWRGWDLVGNGTGSMPNPDNDPEDGTNPHGTTTAGCASAATNNGTGIASPGYRTKILPVKIAGDVTQDVECGYEGIVYAIQMHCDIISCSWSIGTVLDPVLYNIADYAFDQGTLFIASAGNSGNILEEDSPSKYYAPRILYVGATNQQAERADFSSYGTFVDVFAPGDEILTTVVGGWYDQKSGTSFSSPYAAGVAALVMAVHPDWTPDQVAKQLRVTSAPFISGVTPQEYGIIDAYAAVKKNASLNDIPGIQLKRFVVDNNGSNCISAIPQTATITAVFQNLLAPTSSSASITLSFSDPSISSTISAIQLGTLATLDSISVTFDVTFGKGFANSDGEVRVLFTITDGTYRDYQTGFIPVYITDAWHQVFTPSMDGPFLKINAVNESVIWAMQHAATGDYVLFRSIDGGDSWVDVSDPNMNDMYVSLYAFSAFDENHAMVGGSHMDPEILGRCIGDVFRTTDGGATWLYDSIPDVASTVFNMYMFDTQNAILIGNPSSSQWEIAKTSDGGYSWHTIANPPYGNFQCASAFSLEFCGDMGWFGNESGQIFKTTDRGETWSTISVPPSKSRMISFRNENEVVSRYEQCGLTSSCGVRYTSNGGSTWTTLEPIPAEEYGFAVLEPKGQQLWVGNTYSIHRSFDNGLTWETEALPGNIYDELNVADIYSNTDSTWVWAAGNTIFKRTTKYYPQTVGVEHIPSADGFAIGVYPNPIPQGIQATLAIDGASECTVAIYDIYGRKAGKTFHYSSEGTASISTAGLAAGIYTVVVQHGTIQKTARFTVLK